MTKKLGHHHDVFNSSATYLLFTARSQQFTHFSHVLGCVSFVWNVISLAMRGQFLCFGRHICRLTRILLESIKPKTQARFSSIQKHLLSQAREYPEKSPSNACFSCAWLVPSTYKVHHSLRYLPAGYENRVSRDLLKQMASIYGILDSQVIHPTKYSE